MHAKLIINLILIAVTINLVPYISSGTSSSLLAYQDYVMAGIIALLVMPFVKPLFD